MNRSAFLNTLNLTQFLNNRTNVSGSRPTCCGQGTESADVDTKDYGSKFPLRNWGSALPSSFPSLHPQQHDGCLKDVQFVVFLVLNLVCLLILCFLVWLLIYDCMICLVYRRRRRRGRGDVETGPSTDNSAAGADNSHRLGFANNTYDTSATRSRERGDHFSNTVEQRTGQTHPLPPFSASSTHTIQPPRLPPPVSGRAEARGLKVRTSSRASGACAEHRGHAQERHRKKSPGFVQE